MANLTITEVERCGMTLLDGQLVAAPELPGPHEGKLAIGGGSLVSTPFTTKTRFVRVNCDIACCLAWAGPDDPDPVAIVDLHRLGPNETDFVSVRPGGRVAVIASPT